MTEASGPASGVANEATPARALLVVFIVAITCATAVSLTAVVLEPAREAHRAAERQEILRSLIARVPGVGDVLGDAAGQVEARLVDLETGDHAPVDDPAADGTAGTADVAIPPELDVAGLGRRPARQVVYVLERDGRVVLVVLPVSGRGYASIMRGHLALEGDGDTVVALTITEHSETPGLGARIADPAWREEWQGKRVRGSDGALRLRVADAAVDPTSSAARHEVDAITGATRTGLGITNMLRYWLGDHGYGPFLDRLREEGGET